VAKEKEKEVNAPTLSQYHLENLGAFLPYNFVDNKQAATAEAATVEWEADTNCTQILPYCI
jgi:hypothetical protein